MAGNDGQFQREEVNSDGEKEKGMQCVPVLDREKRP